MANQIVNISWKDAVSETALKCGDPFFRDFGKNIYSQAVFRAERGIAKRYNILDRLLTIPNPNASGELTISPSNFNGEWRVSIMRSGTETPHEYERCDDITVDNIEMKVSLPKYRYSLKYMTNKYVFKYNFPTANDIINIYYSSSIASEEDYTTLDDQGNPNLIPVLPNKYYEETVRRAVIYIAELGIGTFNGNKYKRFAGILKRYSRPDDMLPERGLEKDRPWIMMKAYSVEFPGR